jgi:hypothetical protein
MYYFSNCNNNFKLINKRITFLINYVFNLIIDFVDPSTSKIFFLKNY